MATFDNTIIDYQGLQAAGLEEQLEAITDLARIMELMEWGRRLPEANELDGDAALLQSLLWPLRSIASAALDNYRKRTEAA